MPTTVKMKLFNMKKKKKKCKNNDPVKKLKIKKLMPLSVGSNPEPQEQTTDKKMLKNRNCMVKLYCKEMNNEPIAVGPLCHVTELTIQSQVHHSLPLTNRLVNCAINLHKPKNSVLMLSRQCYHNWLPKTLGVTLVPHIIRLLLKSLLAPYLRSMLIHSYSVTIFILRNVCFPNAMMVYVARLGRYLGNFENNTRQILILFVRCLENIFESYKKD